MLFHILFMVCFPCILIFRKFKSLYRHINQLDFYDCRLSRDSSPHHTSNWEDRELGYRFSLLPTGSRRISSSVHFLYEGYSIPGPIFLRDNERYSIWKTPDFLLDNVYCSFSKREIIVILNCAGCHSLIVLLVDFTNYFKCDLFAGSARLHVFAITSKRSITKTRASSVVALWGKGNIASHHLDLFSAPASIILLKIWCFCMRDAVRKRIFKSTSI